MALSPEEQQELAQLEAKYAPKKKGLTPLEEKELEELSAKYDKPAQQNTQPQEEPGLLAKGLDYGARGLDALGGGARFAAAGLANIPYAIATGKSLTKPEDLGRVMTGQAPTTSEYMERAGVPEGPRFNLSPAEGDTPLRDIVGFAGDVATDPLTYLGLPGLGRAGKPVAEGVEALGRRAYKSGFKKIDERLAEKGAKPLSDVLLEHGAPTGTTKTVAKDVQQIYKDTGSARDALYQKATEKGVTVDLGFPMQEAEKVLAKAAKNPGTRKKAEALREILDAYKKEGKVPIGELSDWKSQIYDALPDNAFGIDGKPRGLSAQFERALSADFRKAIIEAGNKAEKGLGDQIDKLNETLGSIKGSKKPTKMQIRRGETPNFGTSVDAILAGTGHAGALPLKKGADLAKTTYARTKFGKGLLNAADTGLLDPASRRILIDYYKKKDE